MTFPAAAEGLNMLLVVCDGDKTLPSDMAMPLWEKLSLSDTVSL